jgi:hypothetical protein
MVYRQTANRFTSDVRGPLQILDYVAQKAEMYQLRDAVKNWKKKVRGCRKPKPLFEVYRPFNQLSLTGPGRWH